MDEQKFFLCEHCGNLVGMINNAGVKIICCGQPMDELLANAKDAVVEKHVPSVKVDGESVEVCVGSVTHPMLEEHRISFIYLQTEQGGQRKNLKVSAEPKACFKLAGGDKAVAVFAYCNLHGLWKADI